MASARRGVIGSGSALMALGLALAGAGCSRRAATPSPAPVPSGLKAPRLDSLARPGFVGASDEDVHLWKAVRRFYRRRGNQPVWFAAGEPRREAADLVAAVARAPLEGLDAAAYDLGQAALLAGPASSPAASGQEIDAAQTHEAELRFTYVFMKYATHLLVGRVDPHELDPKWVGWTRRIDLPDLLEEALGRAGVAATLERLIPRHPQYTLLKKALERYRGARPANLPPLALQASARDRIRTIELNLERWRWLPEELGKRHILVNIPSFQLQAFEDGRIALEMRVAVGRKDHATPIFSDEMTYVVFSPYWNIPPRIAREEWIPEVLRDPAYLRDNGLEIIKDDRVVAPQDVDWSADLGELRLRQRPGGRNSLGLVKFAFPNRFNIYLHDTPFDSDFHKGSRDFSHGCVRVEKPVELVQWALAGQKEWTRKRIEAAMHAGRERRVTLARPVPVYLVYQTAWATQAGEVSFSEDLYGHDAAQIELLEGGPG
jgi:murein L,D-transpeptidase YcbB/YkuD